MSNGSAHAIADHRLVVEAFSSIHDKEALAWSVLDTKSENAVTRAIAVSANRRAGIRVAHVEYPPRLDLALIEKGVPVAVYEAKAAYATDFQQRRISKNNWYLGRCMDDDLVKLHGVRLLYPTLRQWSGLFFVYEVSDPRRQLKYGGTRPVAAARALEALRDQVKLGRLSAHASIDCGNVDGTDVRIHMCVFDPAGVTSPNRGQKEMSHER